jgi:hypothetical protein
MDCELVRASKVVLSLSLNDVVSTSGVAQAVWHQRLYGRFYRGDGSYIGAKRWMIQDSCCKGGRE